MKKVIIKISPQGQITLPAYMRKKLQLPTGTYAFCYMKNKKIHIAPIREM